MSKKGKLVFVFILVLQLLIMSCLSNLNIVYAAPSISNDTTNKIVTITGTGYQLKFNYNSKAMITSFKLGTHEFLGSGSSSGGIYSAVCSSGTWETSQSLSTSPTVSVSGSVVTATFSTSVANETWTFTAYDDRVTYRLSRTYNGSYSVTRQGTPILDFDQHAAENIRWSGDGGNWPVEGASVTSGYFPGYWIGPTSPNRTDMRISKEQLSFTVLNSTYNDALKIDGTSSFSSTTRGESTLVERLPDVYNGHLRFYMVLAQGGLQYGLSPKMPDGSIPQGQYFSCATSGPSTQGYWGHHSTRGEWLFNPVSVSNGQNVWTELTFSPDTYSKYYDLGTLNGLSNSTNLSRMVNDYGRWAIADKAHAGYFEGPNWRNELVPSEYQWLTQLIDTFQLNKSAAIGAMKGGLADQRDYLQDPDGHLYTGVTTVIKSNSWGRNLADSQCGYVLGVCDTYNMSGDTTWLNGFKTSCENALDYELSTYCNSTTKLVRTDTAAHNPNLHSNEYWEISWWNGQNSSACIAQPNGYNSAMLYDALRRWAKLEQNVLGDSTKAAYYNGIADTLKTYYNYDKTSGGCWIPGINSVMLSTTTAEVRYLPAIGAALKSDLLSLSRRKDMAAGYINELKSNSVDFLVNNVYDLGNAGALSDYTHLGTDGGLYGCAAGDGYACFVAANNRSDVKYFTDKWLDKPMSNWYGSSNFTRSAGLAPEGNDNDFPSTANMAWGLYHYIYGFQPGIDRLIVAPFISNEMIGSKVKYNFRGVDLEVEYLGLYKFKVTIPTMPPNANYIVVRWVNQTPNQSGYNVYYTEGGYNTVYTADAEGNIEFGIGGTGTYTLELTNPDAVSTWTTVHDTDPSITYGTSSWQYSTTCPGYINNDAHYTDANGYYAEFTFTGKGIKWIGGKDSGHGKADVYIDGVPDTTGIDTYAPSNTPQQELFVKTWPTGGQHTIKVVVTNTKNPSSSGYYQDVDAFKYLN